MQLYPEVQKKAQEELNNVIGRDVLPTVADRSRLVYLNAIIKETNRWHPGVAVGLPHRTTEDEVYKGL